MLGDRGEMVELPVVDPIKLASAWLSSPLASYTVSPRVCTRFVLQQSICDMMGVPIYAPI